MSIPWLLLACVLVVAFTYAQRFGEQIVRRFAGRESRPRTPNSRYDAVYFGLALAIGLPPIWLLPDSDPLAFTAFILLGVLVGGFAAQYLFGAEVRTTSKND